MANNQVGGIGTPPAGGQGTTGGGSPQAPCGTGASPILADRQVILSVGLTASVIILCTIAGSMLLGNLLVKGWYWVTLFSVLVILAVKIAKGEVDIEKVKGPAYKLAVLSGVLIVITTLWPGFKIGPVNLGGGASYPKVVEKSKFSALSLAAEYGSTVFTASKGEFRIYYKSTHSWWLKDQNGQEFYMKPSDLGLVRFEEFNCSQGTAFSAKAGESGPSQIEFQIIFG